MLIKNLVARVKKYMDSKLGSYGKWMIVKKRKKDPWETIGSLVIIRRM